MPAVLVILFSFAMEPMSYECSETTEGGTCYGALGGPHRFVAHAWGGELFLATAQGRSFHCLASDRDAGLFSRAAASSGYVAVSWDAYHRCTAIDFETPVGIESHSLGRSL